MDKNSMSRKPGGESNTSTVRGSVTGSLEKGTRAGKRGTSANMSGSSPSTLPNWLTTEPEILAGQFRDLLALMRRAGWFVYLVPVTGENRTALSVVVSPPRPHTIGVTGRDSAQIIVVDGVPVTEAK